MVRQHDAAGADANRLRAAGDVRDDDRRRRARNARHVVMLGDPEPPISPPFSMLREVERVPERGRRSAALRDGSRDRGLKTPESSFIIDARRRHADSNPRTREPEIPRPGNLEPITPRPNNMSIRAVKRITQATPTMEGAGVKLHRGFGFGDTSEFDPFLLFDDFRNDRPGGFPQGLPVASASRHRDHHLRARRNRRARRQPRQPAARSARATSSG